MRTAGRLSQPMVNPWRMLALTDHQLATVLTAAASLPVEKRGTLLERIAGRLRQQAGRITDADVSKAVEVSLRGLLVTA
jgi:hypothetical protein